MITFGSSQSLGAGCIQEFTAEQRCNWYRYIMTTEGVWGRGIVYDPVPLMYSEYFDDKQYADFALSWTFGRHGGLAYIGHELVVGSYDPTHTYYSAFNGHGIQDYKKSDATGRAHQYRLYTSVLEQQQELYSNTNDITHDDYNDNNDNDDDNFSNNNNNNNYMPTTGFSIGSLCNTNENMCVSGSDCKRTSWWHD